MEWEREKRKQTNEKKKRRRRREGRGVYVCACSRRDPDGVNARVQHGTNTHNTPHVPRSIGSKQIRFLFDERWRLAARFTVDKSARLIGTCNSLLCFLVKHADAIRVVDPFAGASIDVPLSPAKHGSTVGSDYTYKSLPKDGASAEKELHVFTVGADRRWRSVRIHTDLHGVPYKDDGFAEKKAACCDGAVYWLGKTSAGTFKNARLDLATEEITSADDRLVHGQMPATQISCVYQGAKVGLCGVQFAWYGEWDDGCWPRNVTAMPQRTRSPTFIIREAI
ncbi:hypothetical protein ZWY2020_009796 [Hordeum vulgare]|nr:hypothetical protein ZWY2020_009796 [Hordeum vulgare]